MLKLTNGLPQSIFRAGRILTSRWSSQFLMPTAYRLLKKYKKMALNTILPNGISTFWKTTRSYCRRYGLCGYEDSTLEQVAQELGVTRERVRQIQMDALKEWKKSWNLMLSFEAIFNWCYTLFSPRTTAWMQEQRSGMPRHEVIAWLFLRDLVPSWWISYYEIA